MIDAGLAGAQPGRPRVALVELLAYAGDQLSYYQDAVATEAYLGTARRRVSVRRHARLVDYPMHDGAQRPGLGRSRSAGSRGTATSGLPARDAVADPRRRTARAWTRPT